MSLSAIKLFTRLDAHMSTTTNSRNSPLDTDIEESLKLAIQAFAARWLHLAPSCQISSAQMKDMICHSWRAARRDMLKVIHRTSYRSFLTLYLFAHTPIPSGISEDEEQDGMSAQVCMQTAMYQLQCLRERRKAPGLAEVTSELIDLENRAFWVAMMWDTSSSLVSGARTSLSSGLNGACSEPTWRLVRAFLVGSFKSRTETWHDDSFDINNDNAYEIIAAGVIGKTYIWKTITSFKEALREGVHDDGVKFAWQALLDTIDIWDTPIRGLLAKCERRLPFLDQRVRLNWYGLSVQYYLGIAHLVQVLIDAGRVDLLSAIAKTKQDADCESYNVLKFGLENTYTICQEPLVNASITAIDPYPRHSLDLVLLLDETLRRNLNRGDITGNTYSHLRSILCSTLRHLPQDSKAVEEARETFEQVDL